MKIPAEAIEAAKGLKRYKHYQIPKGVCYDCRISYNDFEDMIIDDALWALITPVADRDPDAGILCPSCMVNRLNKIGMWYDFLNPRLSGVVEEPATDVGNHGPFIPMSTYQWALENGVVHKGHKVVEQVKRKLGVKPKHPTRNNLKLNKKKDDNNDT